MFHSGNTPLGRVIPHSATVFGYPVESPNIAVRQKEIRSHRNCRGRKTGRAAAVDRATRIDQVAASSREGVTADSLSWKREKRLCQ